MENTLARPLFGANEKTMDLVQPSLWLLNTILDLTEPARHQLLQVAFALYVVRGQRQTDRWIVWGDQQFRETRQFLQFTTNTPDKEPRGSLAVASDGHLRAILRMSRDGALHVLS